MVVRTLSSPAPDEFNLFATFLLSVKKPTTGRRRLTERRGIGTGEERNERQRRGEGKRRRAKFGSPF